MKIKIISDGTSQGTSVVDAESGEVVPGVQLVNFTCAVGEAPEAFLHVVGISCEIVTEAAEALMPDLNPFQVQDLDMLPDEIKDFFNDDSTD